MLQTVNAGCFVDLQSVVYGMVFAFGYHLLLKKGIIADNHNKSLFSTGITLSLTVLGFIGLGVSV